MKITMEQEESIRHLARFRVKYDGQDDWAEGSREYLFFDEAADWCFLEMSQYDVFLPDSFNIFKSYDGGVTWKPCGNLKWDLLTMKSVGDAEDWGEPPDVDDYEGLTRP